MAGSDSEDEAGDYLELDRTTDADGEEDDDALDALDALDADATEGDEESDSDDSDDSEDEGDGDDESEPAMESTQDRTVDTQDGDSRPSATKHESLSQTAKASPPPKCTRSLSPAQKRKRALLLPSQTSFPRTYTVEAICALPHPAPTHALASSLCMTHLVTGSDDGYIRDYDIFSAVNGKIFLTAPQRSHSGVVEGIMKSGQIRCWWENPSRKLESEDAADDEQRLAPVYSMSMHSDALWMLSGSDTGNINLFTVRHEPGRLCHVMTGHRGPVSSLSMGHDEKGFFSAGWDGEALHWDLNTGQVSRKFTAHGAQLAVVAVRPLTAAYREDTPSVVYRPVPPPNEAPPSRRSTITTDPGNSQTASSTIPNTATTSSLSDGSIQQKFSQPVPPAQQDSDTRSDTSFDPLFDDEEDADGDFDVASQPALNLIPRGGPNPSLAMPSTAQPPNFQPPQYPQSTQRSLAPPKNAPPLLDPPTYATFSPDILITASIDGQVILWDKRVQGDEGKGGVGRLWMSDKTPPWCLSACWSADGGQIYAGRRNGTVDVWDVRQLGVSGPTSTPRLLKTLRNPLSSGVVSCVVAFPDGKHIACASIDNIRLWNAAEAGEPDALGKMKSGVQFKIIPGHHGGYVSQMLVDPAARFLVSASSNRGWHGESTKTVFVHHVKHIQ